MAAAARELGASGDPSPLARAERITTWVHQALQYGPGTTVHTTAAEALAAGSGVGQDYAHVMLAIARRSGLAARYVSGHLVGEGGSHAWVEVLVPDDAEPASALATAFDPTNDRRADDQYVTVAVGRDYADVAPTSGTFRACRRSCWGSPTPTRSRASRHPSGPSTRPRGRCATRPGATACGCACATAAAAR